ncbi:MAG: trigger factor [Acidimicrobiales bacterium]|nr:trigger factor [Acidimicrobiales bacterium]
MNPLSLRLRKFRAATSDVADPEPEATTEPVATTEAAPQDSRPDSVHTTLETLDGDRVKMTVSVDETEFERAVDRAFRKLAHEVRLPGFRPGKAPRKLLEARLGTAAGRHEAIQDAVPEYYRKALIEHAVDAINSPSLEITSGEEAGDLVFDAVVPVRPQVSVSGYASLSVEVPAPNASEADIATQVDTLRRQHGTLEVVERAAADGDQVTIDIEGSHNGEPVEGLTATDYLYEVGTGAVVADIDENLRDASAGDTLEFDADHPQEEGSLHLRIVVKEVQALVLPEADDAFAAEASEFDTIDELTDDLRTRISSMKQAQAAVMAREHIARAVAGLVADELPAALVESAIDDRIRDMAIRMAQQGIDFARWIEATGQDTVAMREGFRTEAELSARADLGLRAVAFAEGIDADEADVEAHLALMAAQSGQPDTDLDELREGMARAGHLLELLADLRKQAAMDWLFEQVGFVDEEGNEIDRDDLRPSESEVVISGEEPEAAEAAEAADPDPDPDPDHEQEPSA